MDCPRFNPHGNGTVGGGVKRALKLSGCRPVLSGHQTVFLSTGRMLKTISSPRRLSSLIISSKSSEGKGNLVAVDLETRNHLYSDHTSILNSAPSAVLRTESVPPMFFSMMVFAMYNPIPVPLSGPLVVK